MSGKPCLITARNLSLGYNGRIVAKDISFSVTEGDFLCVAGHNGAGKSTLLKTLLGLQPLLSGTLTFSPSCRTRIGYLPQQTEAQKDFPASVREIVLSGFQASKRFPFYTKAERAAVRDNIALMGMGAFESRPFRELSGGQKQRVLLARALCAVQPGSSGDADHKPLLVLDEPTASLDPEASSLFNSLLASLNRDRGMTIIEISHDIDTALRTVNRVLHIADEPFFGTVDEYRKSRQFGMFGKEASWRT